MFNKARCNSAAQARAINNGVKTLVRAREKKSGEDVRAHPARDTKSAHLDTPVALVGME